MSLHLPSLDVAVAAALFIAAVLSTTIVLRQRARRGSLWWIAGHLLLVASLGLQAWDGHHDIVAPIAALLALQWPIAMLVGVRQFYSRGAGSLPAWADAIVLAIAALVACGIWLAPVESVSPGQVFAIAMLVVTLYAATAVARLEDFAVTSTLKLLVAGLVASVAVQGIWLVVAFSAVPFAIAAADVGAAATLATAALALLSTQITLAMNHERQIAHLRASQRKLRHLVDVDDVTRLPNRRHFHELAERAVAPAPELATVLFFDVDQLKRLNELLGHANGDEALRQIGTALRETLRRRDVAGRLGGDEFAAVLPRTRVADAANVVARINARLEDRQIAPRIARVVLNVGMTQMLAGETLADALRRAESGMTLQRDETRKLATQKVAIVAEAATLRAHEPKPSQMAALNAIPVGEVVLG
ncbi:MAG: GGDEF domain-containing protein [Caldimonas sp.]